MTESIEPNCQQFSTMVNPVGEEFDTGLVQIDTRELSIELPNLADEISSVHEAAINNLSKQAADCRTRIVLNKARLFEGNFITRQRKREITSLFVLPESNVRFLSLNLTTSHRDDDNSPYEISTMVGCKPVTFGLDTGAGQAPFQKLKPYLWYQCVICDVQMFEPFSAADFRGNRLCLWIHLRHKIKKTKTTSDDQVSRTAELPKTFTERFPPHGSSNSKKKMIKTYNAVRNAFR
nr:hypothetical transcript [Hymenolepis microstoma]